MLDAILFVCNRSQLLSISLVGVCLRDEVIGLRERNMSMREIAKKLKVSNCPEANRFLSREYRKGWEL